MKTTVLSASQVIANAIGEGRFVVKGSEARLLKYFAGAVGGKSGFIVDGDLNRFAEYFLLAASGGSAVLTEAAASGASGFVIKGDFELAWSKRFFANAASGASGFVVEQAKLRVLAVHVEFVGTRTLPCSGSICQAFRHLSKSAPRLLLAVLLSYARTEV